ncbi:TetR/AcrR family transcriptional regulator [bacterium]|nr:TetR/AcrR family transcriptional regulator [bacterium]
MARPSSKERILKAAETIVARDGAAHLTLDAVAAEAGISKGGLLYHFKTKQALIAAILDAHCKAAIAAHEAEVKRLGPNMKSELEAYLQATQASEKDPLYDRQIGVAIIAAIANEPEIARAASDRFDDLENRLWGKRENFNADAAIIWLAAHGLKFFHLVDHEPFTPEQRKAILDRMLHLAREQGEKSS